jgi:cyclopropane fatty-acyl-phospholipid synthase-like methyltransferase
MAAAYDRIAERYREARTDRLSANNRRFLDLLVAELPAGANVLDAGCGWGVPIGRFLLARGYRVTGLDGSRRQLEHAREAVPEMTLVYGDMRSVDPGGPFAATVAWDSVFHVPRADHADLFRRFRSWLEPGGLLLISLGGSEGEFTDTMLGDTFFYSGHAPAESVRLLEAAGFEILHQEIDDPQSRGHFVVLARNPGI